MAEQPTQPKEKPASPPAAPARPASPMRNRRAFLVDGAGQILAIAIIEGLVIVALVIAWAVTIMVLKPEDKFFALTAPEKEGQVGRIFALQALSEPNMTNSALVAWAAQAATDVMTVSVGDYDARQLEHQKYFTPDGWKSFSSARKLVGERDKVMRNRQVITAAPKAAPSIVEKGVRNGIYFWNIQIPMVITYSVGNTQQAAEKNFGLLVQRVSTSVNAFGVGIEQWTTI